MVIYFMVQGVESKRGSGEDSFPRVVLAALGAIAT